LGKGRRGGNGVWGRRGGKKKPEGGGNRGNTGAKTLNLRGEGRWSKKIPRSASGLLTLKLEKKENAFECSLEQSNRTTGNRECGRGSLGAKKAKRTH